MRVMYKYMSNIIISYNIFENKHIHDNTSCSNIHQCAVIFHKLWKEATKLNT